MAGTPPLEAPLFVEEDGLVVMEAESHPPVKGWTRKTEPAGFSGSGYLKAEGGGLMCFPIFISTPGRYTMNLHNRHDHDRGDLENDAFVRMDDGPFIKCFSSPAKQWTWASTLEYSGDRKVPPEYDLAVGLHRLEIRQRSENFMIDRIALFLSSGDHSKRARDLSRPETRGTPAMPALPGRPKAAAAWASGRLGAALADLEAAAAGDEGAAAAAKLIRAALEKRRADLDAVKQTDPLGASEALDFYAGRFLGGHPLGKEWTSAAASWRAEPAARAELKARLLLGTILEQVKGIRTPGKPDDPAFMKANARPLAAIHQALTTLRKSYPDTGSRKRAEQIAAEVGLGGG
jgi:hypothetical protein